MPPATLTPTARPVWRWKSRAASIMHRAPACVALEAILPVEVLMKSAPAAMASIEALRTWSYDPSSPISRITFRCAVPQASLDRVISSNAWWYRPERNAERFSTMSISSAPHRTACRAMRLAPRARPRRPGSPGPWPPRPPVGSTATRGPSCGSRRGPWPSRLPGTSMIPLGTVATDYARFDGSHDHRRGAGPHRLRRGRDPSAASGVAHTGGHVRPDRGEPIAHATRGCRVRGRHGHRQTRGHDPARGQRVRAGVSDGVGRAGPEADASRVRAPQLQRRGDGRGHRHPAGRDGPDRGDRRRGSLGRARVLLRVPPVPRHGGADHGLRGRLALGLKRSFFDPLCVAVSSTQSLSLTNAGNLDHNLTVQGSDLSIDLAPGEEEETSEVGEFLQARTHRFFCRFHQDEGMVGTIVVE